MSEATANAEWIRNVVCTLRFRGTFSLYDGDIPRLREIASALECHDALLSACKSWVQYFDWLEQQSAGGDPLGLARRKYHAKRLEQTAAAIALAEQEGSDATS